MQSGMTTQATLARDPLWPIVAPSHTTQSWFDRKPVLVPGAGWVAGEDLAHDLEALNAMGITHIVNCASAEVKNSKEALRARAVLEIPARDAPDFNILGYLDTVQRFLTAVPAHQTLFHCHAGVNRSVTLALAVAYLKSPYALSTLTAMVAMNRPALTNAGFRRALATWAQSVRAVGWKTDATL